MYDRIVFDGRVAPSFLRHADSGDRVIVVNSFSKSWAMTGWRLGWMTAPGRMGPVLEKMNELNVAGAATFTSASPPIPAFGSRAPRRPSTPSSPWRG